VKQGHRRDESLSVTFGETVRPPGTGAGGSQADPRVKKAKDIARKNSGAEARFPSAGPPIPFTPSIEIEDLARQPTLRVPQSGHHSFFLPHALGTPIRTIGIFPRAMKDVVYYVVGPSRSGLQRPALPVAEPRGCISTRRGHPRRCNQPDLLFDVSDVFPKRSWIPSRGTRPHLSFVGRQGSRRSQDHPTVFGACAAHVKQAETTALPVLGKYEAGGAYSGSNPCEAIAAEHPGFAEKKRCGRRRKGDSPAACKPKKVEANKVPPARNDRGASRRTQHEEAR